MAAVETNIPNGTEPSYGQQLAGKLKAYFADTTQADPRYKALVDFLELGERSMTLGGIREDEHETKAHQGAREYARLEFDAIQAEKDIQRDISTKDRGIPGYLQARLAISHAFSTLAELYITDVFNDKGDDYPDAREDAFLAAMDLLKDIRAEIVERTTDKDTQDLLHATEELHNLWLVSLAEPDVATEDHTRDESPKA